MLEQIADFFDQSDVFEPKAQSFIHAIAGLGDSLLAVLETEYGV